jgi:hypothetical protein
MQRLASGYDGTWDLVDYRQINLPTRPDHQSVIIYCSVGTEELIMCVLTYVVRTYVFRRDEEFKPRRQVTSSEVNHVNLAPIFHGSESTKQSR